MHGAGSQCRQRVGKVKKSTPKPTLILGLGWGLSLKIEIKSLLEECSKAQAVSQCLQPTHRSTSINTVFMQSSSHEKLIFLLSRFLRPGLNARKPTNCIEHMISVPN
jgi:hypothetical protein